ncbi:hypothetical protein COR51_23695 [Vibrio mediterranei]|uniref:Uncharacterized protein n=1 Tax=Vibrio mediterranei TaxID=689 RepID=A0ABX5D623_9VIBR|nr:hypothetical protein COR51_23695 [Vibrio mediterranei]
MNDWYEEICFMPLKQRRALLAIPLLMLRGLSLDEAIVCRHRAHVSLCELTMDSLCDYRQITNRHSDVYLNGLYERLIRFGFYDERYLYLGFELVNPWDFSK